MFDGLSALEKLGLLYRMSANVRVMQCQADKSMLHVFFREEFHDEKCGCVFPKEVV